MWTEIDDKQKQLLKVAAIVIGAAVILPVVTYAGIRGYYAGRILPGVSVGEVSVGRLKKDVAQEKLEARIAALANPGILVEFQTGDGVRREPVPVTLSVDAEALANEAYLVGRSGGFLGRLSALLGLIGEPTRLSVSPTLDRVPVEVVIEKLAPVVEAPGYDVRLHIQQGTVEVLTDTKSGYSLEREDLIETILFAARNLDEGPVEGRYREQVPVIDPSTAQAAKEEAERMIESFTLVDRGERYTVSRATVGSWLTSVADQRALRVEIAPEALRSFIVTLSDDVNEPAQNLGVKVENGKVVEFIAPKPGRVVNTPELEKVLRDLLDARRRNEETAKELELPVKIAEAQVEGNATELGIEELIGRATTTFTGSPKNRIANIKNGVRFLTGIIVGPGEEFSTIQSLGTIDDTTGYLPELVIRGNRTLPEFGGGLCQVSTTLFRSVLNAGLPVTARRNHSYRVSYYEKDGDGKYIGPGLDATIYDPNPDFRFKNDTAHSILVTGYVIGDRITFELYGKKDGRTGTVTGPTLLSSSPPGEPIYIETDDLAPGEKKQIEKPHPGGSASATYVITYADGRTDETVFTSSYRPWPAQYLIGRDPNAPTESDADDVTPPTTSDAPTDAVSQSPVAL